MIANNDPLNQNQKKQQEFQNSQYLKPSIKRKSYDPISHSRKNIKTEQPENTHFKTQNHKNTQRESVASIKQMKRNQTFITKLQALISSEEESSIHGKTYDNNRSRTSTIRNLDAYRPSQLYPSKPSFCHQQHLSSNMVKVNTLSVNPESKPSKTTPQMKNLQALLSACQHDKTILQKSLNQLLKSFHSLETKYKQLQILFKEQAVINLSLQKLITTFIHTQKQKLNEQSNIINNLNNLHTFKEKQFSSKIKDMEKEFLTTLSQNQEYIHNLLNELKNKSTEIRKLKVNEKMLSLQNNRILQKHTNTTVFSNNGIKESSRGTSPEYYQESQKVSQIPFNEPTGKIAEEPAFETTLQLPSRFFYSGHQKARPYCKTDRI